MVTALRLSDRPSLAIDCRFLEDMSPRAAQLTGAQLRYLVTSNKNKRQGFAFFSFYPGNCSETHGLYILLTLISIPLLHHP